MTFARSLEKLAFGELFRHVEGVKRGHTAMNQHQAAIWGAGGIAQTHAMALRAVGIPIRTVVSHSEAGARAFAQQWGIPEWSTDPAALLDAVFTLRDQCGLDIAKAFALVTINPAKAAGIADEVGSIAVGKRAD